MTERVHSACPHDCPSTCALEVERVDQGTIGKIYGAKDNPYTAGVICAKVSRYAERVHHPDRLTRPLMRMANRRMFGKFKKYTEAYAAGELELVSSV